MKTRVLVVDDSAAVRLVLTKGLAQDPDIEVVGAASDAYEARDWLVRERPDVMTLDIEMPRMDGVTFLRKFMPVIPTATIVLSSLTASGSKLALEALEAGALDVIEKPGPTAASLDSMMDLLRRKVKLAALAKVPMPRASGSHEVPAPRASGAHAISIPRREQSEESVIGLGASTGGVTALSRILPAFPAWAPAVIVVQHMPTGFTAEFAARLAPRCPMTVREAKDGERVQRGTILIGPGGSRHLEVVRTAGICRVILTDGPPVSGHRPSVDVFFRSLARAAGPNAAACLMTGMGADGARGLLDVSLAGGRTFAQSQDTCAVWGMPAAAVELNATRELVALDAIPSTLLRALPR